MRFRKLRIAWAIWWGLLAVLVCALWVRSYTHPQEWRIGRWPWEFRRALTAVRSEYGELMFASFSPAEPTDWYGNLFILHPKSAFYYQEDTGVYEAGVPHWSPLLACIAFAIAPWPLRRFRFSLRTLLIATTVVAVLLGLSAYLFRH